MKTDAELLREFVKSGAEDSFAELVKRHIGLVYSTAYRETKGDGLAAGDVSQLVFIELARKAASLRGHPTLAGWLYSTAHYVSANIRRTEKRRTSREQETHTMSELLRSNSNDPAWEEVRPVIDDCLQELSEDDRSAVLLRFFSGKNLREVGESLRLTENAARMRVDRALEKLRKLLVRRGIQSSSSALATALSVGFIAAPASVTAAATGAGLTAASVANVSASTLFGVISMTKTKIALMSAVLIAAVVTPTVIQLQNVRLRRENAALRQISNSVQENQLVLSSQRGITEPVTESSRLDWRALESSDYRKYVANLRAAGIPEQVVRDIIVTDLDRTYGQRIANLQAPASAKEYWKMGSYKGAVRQSVEVKQIEEQRHAAIHDLLGIDADEESQRRTGFSIPYDEGFEFLPAEKRARLREIDRDYNAKRLAREGSPLPGPGPNDPLNEGNALEARDAAVRELLSPEEFREYEMRFGDHNGFLRTALKAFEPSEQEFRKISEIENQFLSVKSDTAGGDGTVREETPSPFAKWVIPDAANNQQLQDALRQALGDQRYEDYKLCGDNRFVILYDITQEYNLGKDAARAAYDLDTAAVAQAKTIRNDPALTTEARDVACQGLRKQTETQITKLLGNDGFNLFQLQLRGDLNQIAPEPSN